MKNHTPRKVEWYIKKYGKELGVVMFGLRTKYKRLPWNKAYENIRRRCLDSRCREFSDYGGRGIKCEVLPRELKELFFRDKAHLLGIPSVDRIDPEGSYTKSNIHWIEFDINRQHRKMSHPVRAAQCEEIFNIISTKQKEFRWHNKLMVSCLNELLKRFR